MYLLTASIALDLEPEVPVSDRERILRALKERLKKQFQGRIIVRTNEQENGFVIAFFCDHYARISQIMDELFDKLESAGEARILSHKQQIFSWFENRFVETQDGTITKDNLEPKTRKKDVVYDHHDDYPDVESIPRFSRKNIRIPTRK